MKVGHKARRGRKRSSPGHRSHRTPHAITDPITRAYCRRRTVELARLEELELDAEVDTAAFPSDGARTIVDA